MKVGILTETQSRNDKPRDFVSKNAANAMCRRLTHVRISKYLIQAVHVREFVQIGTPYVHVTRTSRNREHRYEHHLEPKVHQFTLGDSEWMRYLYGYGQ